MKLGHGGTVLRAAALAAVILPFAPRAHAAAGLRTKFGSVRVRGLKIGQTYSLNKLINLPLRLVNTGDHAVELNIEVMPAAASTQSGYEYIPDVSWIKLEKQNFTVEPGHEAVTDIIISIPNDPKLVGKRFEVHFWSKTRSYYGSFAAGIESQLLIEVASVLPTEDELKQKFVDRRLANLDFTLFPTEGAAEDIPLGTDFDLKKERKLSIKLVNPNDATLHFKIRPVPSWESELRPPDGFETPQDYAWVRPSTDTVLIEGNSIKEIPLIVNIPNEERFRGRSYFFSIGVEILEQEIPARVYYKLGLRTSRAPDKGTGK